MTTNNPQKIDIPEHWFTDDNVTTYWFHPEGIWVDNSTEPYLRVVAVYLSLIDLPEAKSHLDQCNEQFVNEFSNDLLDIFAPVIKQARAGQPVSKPEMSEASTSRIEAIYKPWGDTWALGSPKMMELIVGMHIVRIIGKLLPLNREDLRRAKRRIIQIGSEYSPPWVWETLLSSEYKRMDEANRESARKEIRSRGFRSKRERTLLIHARCWVCIRILGTKEKDLLDKLAERSPKKDFKLTSEDLTDRVLRPFDDVFDFKRKRGRPTAAKNVTGSGVKMR